MRTRPQVVTARVTDDEKKLIIAAAQAEGLPVSEFVMQILVARAEYVLNAPDGDPEPEAMPPEF